MSDLHFTMPVGNGNSNVIALKGPQPQGVVVQIGEASGGTFNATVTVQSSYDAGGGVNGVQPWVSQDAVTGPAFVLVPYGSLVQIVVSSWVSGQVAVLLKPLPEITIVKPLSKAP